MIRSEQSNATAGVHFLGLVEGCTSAVLLFKIRSLGCFPSRPLIDDHRTFDLLTFATDQLPSAQGANLRIAAPMVIVAGQSVAVVAPFTCIAEERDAHILLVFNVDYGHTAAGSRPGILSANIASVVICHLISSLWLSNDQPVDGQRNIPGCDDQTPGQDKSADDTADDEVERESGNVSSEGSAARNDPEAHPMQTEGQTAENPQLDIIRHSVLYAGRFENADEQHRSNYRQYAIDKKLSDCIASCHGTQPPFHYHYIGQRKTRANNLQTLQVIPKTLP